MTANEIARAIRSGNFNIAEINEIIDSLKFARAMLARQNKRELGPGVAVKFTSSRDGITYSGTVVKVKLKNVEVQTRMGRYNVPASMLEMV
jgi:hypothetical protein